MELKNSLALQDQGTGAAQLLAVQESDAREATVLLGASKGSRAAIPRHWGSAALDKPCRLQEPA